MDVILVRLILTLRFSFRFRILKSTHLCQCMLSDALMTPFEADSYLQGYSSLRFNVQILYGASLKSNSMSTSINLTKNIASRTG